MKPFLRNRRGTLRTDFGARLAGVASAIAMVALSAWEDELRRHYEALYDEAFSTLGVPPWLIHGYGCLPGDCHAPASEVRCS